MGYSVEDMTGVGQPRRRLWAIVAVLVPVIVLVGAALWFVRSYVLPPTMRFEQTAVASTVASPTVEPETTGSSHPPAGVRNSPAPVVRYSNDPAEVWASVPLPGPPRPAQRAAPETANAGEPPNGSVPLPPRRPRVSTSEFDLPAVPLPRPRPALASN